jgi:hypothetical protein
LAATLAAGGLVLFAATAGCASASSSGQVGDPTPLAVKALGSSDGKPDRDGREARRLAVVQGVWRRGDALTVDTEAGVAGRRADGRFVATLHFGS